MAAHPDGVQVQTIREGLAFELPPRTLQRRLALPCARYSAVRQSQGEPDPFRLHYRALIAEMVATVVRTGCDKKGATALIRQRAAEHVPSEDQARIVEVVETELMSLHEGNIARYRLRPAEYQVWRDDRR